MALITADLVDSSDEIITSPCTSSAPSLYHTPLSSPTPPDYGPVGPLRSSLELAVPSLPLPNGHHGSIGAFGSNGHPGISPAHRPARGRSNSVSSNALTVEEVGDRPRSNHHGTSESDGAAASERGPHLVIRHPTTPLAPSRPYNPTPLAQSPVFPPSSDSSLIYLSEPDSIALSDPGPGDASLPKLDLDPSLDDEHEAPFTHSVPPPGLPRSFASIIFPPLPPAGAPPFGPTYFAPPSAAHTQSQGSTAMSAFHPAPGAPHPGLSTSHSPAPVPGSGSGHGPGSQPGPAAAHHLSALSSLLQPLIDQGDQLHSLRMEVGMWKAQWAAADRERQRLEGEVREGREAIEVVRAGMGAKGSKDGFSVVLLDGDGLIFSDALTSQGYEGGLQAAKMLLQSIPHIHAEHSAAAKTEEGDLIVQARIGADGKEEGGSGGATKKAKDIGPMMVMVFLNKQGLGTTLVKAGIVPSYTTYEAFWLGFSRAHELFTVIDVGNGKEASDAKIREHLKLFAKDESCRMIVLGASHDNGYANVLSSLSTESRLNKLLLLKGYADLAAELRQYSSLVISIPDVFRTSKVAWNPAHGHGHGHGHGSGPGSAAGPPNPNTPAADQPQTPFPLKAAAKKAAKEYTASTKAKKAVAVVKKASRRGMVSPRAPKRGLSGLAEGVDAHDILDPTRGGTTTGTSDTASEMDVYEFDELSRALEVSAGAGAGDGAGAKAPSKVAEAAEEEEPDEWVTAGAKRRAKRDKESRSSEGGAEGVMFGAGGGGGGGGARFRAAVNGHARAGGRERSVRELNPRPCHTYYLSPWGCRSGDDCDYAHHYNLSENQIADLARLAKQIPCPFAKDGRCLFAADDCVYGHKCPRLGACSFGETCRFNILPHAHDRGSQTSDYSSD